MKIRSHLIFTYAFLILVIVFILSIRNYTALQQFSEQYQIATEGLAMDITSSEVNLAEEIIGNYAKKMVEMRAIQVANEIAFLLRNKTNPTNNYLRNHQQLRKIASQKIYTLQGIEAGYCDLLDTSGEAIIHPNKSVEGRMFQEYQEQFPEMWNLVSKSFTKDYVNGTYSFIDSNKEKVRKYMFLKHVNNSDLIVVVAVNVDEYFSQVIPIIKASGKSTQERAKAESRELSKKFLPKVTFVKIISSPIVVLIGILFGLYFAKKISTPIYNLKNHLHKMIEGDFSVSIEPEGSIELKQLANSLNELSSHLNSLFAHVKKSAINLMSTATEIAASSHQQEQAVQEFGVSTNQISIATRQITYTTDDLVSTMKTINDKAFITSDLAAKSQTGLSGMEQTMKDFTNSTKKIANKFSIISEKASNITFIIETISQVAEQTNLLSLNAAIEAEKAGDYGLGFSVVATEIRRLADQTAIATLDIEKMIKGMQSSVSSGVMEMDKFMDKVSSGASDVNSISIQLENIVTQIQNLSPSFSVVLEGMKAQTEGTQHIDRAMQKLSIAANRSADSVSEFNKAATQLKKATEKMQDEIRI